MTDPACAQTESDSENRPSPDTVSPAAISSNTVSPDTISTDTVSPNTVSPNTASPVAVSPVAISPVAVSPVAVSLAAVSPNTASPVAVSPVAVSPADRPAGAARWRTYAKPVLGWLLIAVSIAYSFQWGRDYRKWAFEYTAPIRFVWDIERGYFWGRQVAAHGYLNLYDTMAGQGPRDPLWLDYAPLRLAAMGMWGRWTTEHFPRQDQWREGYDLHWPILTFNTAIAAFGSVGIFLLIYTWRRKSRQPAFRRRTRLERWFARTVLRRPIAPIEAPELAPDPKPISSLYGAVPALIGALLFWFNPAVVLSSHGWPTWDMWVIPFYIWGILLAVWDFWFIAGVVIAIGAMFKGQQFFVAPIFLAWPLLQGRVGPPVRWAIGLLFGIGLLAAPWLVSYKPMVGEQLPRILDHTAIAWVVGTVLAAALMWLGWRWPRSRNTDPAKFRRIWLTQLALRSLLTLGCALLVFWPWLRVGYRDNVALPIALTALLLTAAGLLRWRSQWYVWAACLGASLLFCIPLFHGSSAWADCSFGYGTRHWPGMIMGQTSNLGGILKERYHWEDVMETVYTIEPDTLMGWPTEAMEIPMREFLFGLFVLSMVPCIVGVALQHSRRDPRFLLAITAPWLVFFAFPPQVHERYLLFAAGVGMVAAGVSVGSTLLALFLTLVTFIMTIHVMLSNRNWPKFGADISPDFPRQFHNFIFGTYPDIGWAVLLATLIFIYWAIAPSPGRKRLRG